MSSEILSEMIQKIDLLTADEQLRLIAELAEKARISTVGGAVPRRKWSDLIGMLSYPACGEDAQVYISRSRREADDRLLSDGNR